MTSTDSDDLILVDTADTELGILDKLSTHRQGLLHRALSVIVADREGRLMLQKRAAGKYHSGGLWTNTCCSHPRPGEPVDLAAHRRLEEEMGFGCSLRPLFTVHYRADVSNGLIENELVHVFGGRFEGTPQPNPDEVEDWRWSTIGDLRIEMARRPQTFSIWFRKYVKEFGDAIADI